MFPHQYYASHRDIGARSGSVKEEIDAAFRRPPGNAAGYSGNAVSMERGLGMKTSSRVAAPSYAAEENDDSALGTMLQTPAFYGRHPIPAAGFTQGEGVVSPRGRLFEYTPPHDQTDIAPPPRVTTRDAANGHISLQPGPAFGACAPPKGHVKLPQYNGEEPIESYRIQVELAAQLNGWSDEETAMGLAVALRGRAAQVLISLRREERLDYNILMGALEQRFGRPMSMDEAMTKLFVRARAEKESVGAYAAEIQELTLRSYPSYPRALQEDLARTAFVRGLRPYRLKEHVSVFGPRTFREALQEAERVESMLWTPSRAPAYVRSAEWVEEQNEDGAVQSALPAAPPPRQVKKTPRRAPAGRPFPAGCFRCGEPGHMARNCPAPTPRSPPPSPKLNRDGATQ